MSCHKNLIDRSTQIAALKQEITHQNATINTYVVVGDNGNSFLEKDQGYLQFPVNDEYYAFTYKIHQAYLYAHYNNYDALIIVDDDMIVNKYKVIDHIVKNYNPNFYGGPIYHHLPRRERTEHISYANNAFLNRIGSKRIHLAPNPNLIKFCGSFIGGPLYILGKESIKTLTDPKFLQHQLEDVGVSCELQRDPTHIPCNSIDAKYEGFC